MSENPPRLGSDTDDQKGNAKRKGKKPQRGGGRAQALLPASTIITNGAEVQVKGSFAGLDTAIQEKTGVPVALDNDIPVFVPKSRHIGPPKPRPAVLENNLRTVLNSREVRKGGVPARPAKTPETNETNWVPADASEEGVKKGVARAMRRVRLEEEISEKVPVEPIPPQTVDRRRTPEEMEALAASLRAQGNEPSAKMWEGAARMIRSGSNIPAPDEPALPVAKPRVRVKAVTAPIETVPAGSPVAATTFEPTPVDDAARKEKKAAKDAARRERNEIRATAKTNENPIDGWDADAFKAHGDNQKLSALEKENPMDGWDAETFRKFEEQRNKTPEELKNELRGIIRASVESIPGDIKRMDIDPAVLARASKEQKPKISAKALGEAPPVPPVDKEALKAEIQQKRAEYIANEKALLEKAEQESKVYMEALSNYHRNRSTFSRIFGSITASVGVSMPKYLKELENRSELARAAYLQHTVGSVERRRSGWSKEKTEALRARYQQRYGFSEKLITNFEKAAGDAQREGIEGRVPGMVDKAYGWWKATVPEPARVITASALIMGGSITAAGLAGASASAIGVGLLVGGIPAWLRATAAIVKDPEEKKIAATFAKYSSAGGIAGWSFDKLTRWAQADNLAKARETLARGTGDINLGDVDAFRALVRERGNAKNLETEVESQAMVARMLASLVGGVIVGQAIHGGSAHAAEAHGGGATPEVGGRPQAPLNGILPETTPEAPVSSGGAQTPEAPAPQHQTIDTGRGYGGPTRGGESTPAEVQSVRNGGPEGSPFGRVPTPTDSVPMADSQPTLHAAYEQARVEGISVTVDKGDGAIKLFGELKDKLEERYGDYDTMSAGDRAALPESVKEILTTDAETLSREYGFYLPPRSGIIPEGAGMAIDTNGNVLYSEPAASGPDTTYLRQADGKTGLFDGPFDGPVARPAAVTLESAPVPTPKPELPVEAPTATPEAPRPEAPVADAPPAPTSPERAPITVEAPFDGASVEVGRGDGAIEMFKHLQDQLRSEGYTGPMLDKTPTQLAEEYGFYNPETDTLRAGAESAALNPRESIGVTANGEVYHRLADGTQVILTPEKGFDSYYPNRFVDTDTLAPTPSPKPAPEVLNPPPPEPVAPRAAPSEVPPRAPAPAPAPEPIAPRAAPPAPRPPEPAPEAAPQPPREAPPAPSVEGSFVNSHGVEIDTTAAHVYTDNQGRYIAYGGTVDDRVAAATRYLAMNPTAQIYFDSSTADPITGEVNVHLSRLGLINGKLPLQIPDERIDPSLRGPLPTGEDLYKKVA